MALLNREIYNYEDTLANLLANLKAGQRGVVTDTPSPGWDNPWVYRLDSEYFSITANKKYSGGSWVDLDNSCKYLTTQGFKDTYVTTAIPLGETGETALDVAFSATSIVGALNELKGSLGDTEWVRTVIDPSLDYLAPEIPSGKTVKINVSGGLLDNNALESITVASTSHTSLDGAFSGAYRTSLYGALNYLAGISGGSPAGSDTSIQYNDGGSSFGGDNYFIWDYDNLFMYVLCDSEQFCKLGVDEDTESLLVLGDDTTDLEIGHSAGDMWITGNSSDDLVISNAGTGSVTVNGVELLYGGTSSYFLSADGTYHDLTASPYYPDTLYYNVTSPESHTARLAADENETVVDKKLTWDSYYEVSPNGTPGRYEILDTDDWRYAIILGDDSVTWDSLGIVNLSSGDKTNITLNLGTHVISSTAINNIGAINLNAQSILMNRTPEESFDYFEMMGAPHSVKFQYNDSTSTPPSSGEVRFDNASPALSTYMYIADTDYEGKTREAWWDQPWKPGDYITMYNQNDLDEFFMWKILDLSDETGYTKYALALESSSGGSFSDEDYIFLTPIKGESTSNTIDKLRYRFSTTTSTPPNTSTIRYNNATQASATHIYVNYNDYENHGFEDFIQNFKVNDRFAIIRSGKPHQFQLWKVTAVTDVTGDSYVDYTVTYIDGSGSSFSDEDPVELVFLGGDASSASGSGKDIVSNVYVSMSGTPSMSNGVEVTATFDSETYDDEGDFNTSTYEWTAPEDCTVQVDVNLEMSLAAAGQGECRVYLDTGSGYSRIKPNGSAYIGSAGTIYPRASFSLKVDSGDKIKVVGIQFSGYSATMLNTRTFLSIVAWA